MNKFIEQIKTYRLKQKDKAYMKYQADAYTEASIYLLKLIQRGNKINAITNALEAKALSIAVNKLLNRAKELKELENQ